MPAEGNDLWQALLSTGHELATDADYEHHMKLIDQSGDSQLDVNEVGSAIFGALAHRAGGLKHFIGIAEQKGLKDEDELPKE